MKRDDQKSKIKTQCLVPFKKKSRNTDRIIDCDTIVIIGTNHNYVADSHII